MFLRISKGLAVGLAVSALGIGLAGTAAASSFTQGHYTQVSGPLSCRGNVSGTEGGHLSVRVGGHETRSVHALFETLYVDTRLHAQRFFDGSWHLVQVGPHNFGHLGPARNQGNKNVAPFTYPGRTPTSNYPRFHLAVSVDGQYRLVSVTNDWNADGIRVAHLFTTSGSCTIA